MHTFRGLTPRKNDSTWRKTMRQKYTHEVALLDSQQVSLARKTHTHTRLIHNWAHVYCRRHRHSRQDVAIWMVGGKRKSSRQAMICLQP